MSSFINIIRETNMKSEKAEKMIIFHIAYIFSPHAWGTAERE